MYISVFRIQLNICFNMRLMSCKIKNYSLKIVYNILAWWLCSRQPATPSHTKQKHQMCCFCPGTFVRKDWCRTTKKRSWDWSWDGIVSTEGRWKTIKKKYGLKVSYCCISHLGRYVISNGKFYIDILVKSQVSYGEKKWKAARAVFVPLTSVL